MIVSHKMLSKAMRAIANYYGEHQTGYISGDFLVYKQVCNEREVKHLIDVLCSKNLITYEFEQDMRVIRLTPDGKKYFEDRADVAHEKRVENIRYWITTGIAVAALITAIVSIILQYL